MSAVLASITAGIANITMNDVTTCAQTKTGIAVQRHARRAQLERGRDQRDRDGERGRPR